MPTGTLPKEGKALWERVYEDSKGSNCDDACAAKKAWGAVRNAGWSKDENGEWHKKAMLEEFSLTIKRLSIDPQTNVKSWKADASDTIIDSRNDNMTLELFKSFVKRINDDEEAPEQYKSNFWDGGMPYISISHYNDLDGVGVPGNIDAVYVDGHFLKAKGTFHDSSLGAAAWNALIADKESGREDKVRISIGFLDYAHIHKSNGYKFVRKSLDEVCLECLKEKISGVSVGRSFIDGMLVHLALTRVPVNKRTDISPDFDTMEVESMTTRKEDAASIVGEEEAEKLEREEKSKVLNKADLVEFAEAKKTEKDSKKEEEEEYPEEEEEEKDSKDMKKKKSEAVETLSLVLDSATVNIVLETVKNVAASIEEIKASLATEPASPIDSDVSSSKIYESVVGFIQDFNEIEKADLSEEDKLRNLQGSFNALGHAAVDAIKRKAEVPQPTTPGNELVQALSAVMQPIAQKLDLLIANAERPASTTAPTVPQRRSLSSATIEENKSLIKQPAPYDPTKPVKLGDFARRSAGLQ